jgi:hypothetical protein
MTAKKRSAHTRLPPRPLSELRIMKALLAPSPPPAAEKTIHELATKERTRDATTLRLAIIDKLQVLALRRPHALIILAEVLDELLGQHLRLPDEHLDTQDAAKSRTNRTVGRARHHRR